MRSTQLRVTQLRDAVVKTTKMLARDDIKVTQIGAGAYCRFDPRTGKVLSINLPVIPDNPTDEFLLALQGFLDHEVAHALFTDGTTGWGVDAEGNAEPPKGGIHSLTNIVEDTRIERKMAEAFAGSETNLQATRDFITDTLWKKWLAQIDASAAPQEQKDAMRRTVGFVPYLRARAGQVSCEKFLTDNGLMPLYDELDRRIPDLAERLKALQSTAEARALAEDIEKAITPPAPPPPPPQPEPEEQDESEQPPPPEDSDEGEEGKQPPKGKEPEKKDKPESSDDEGEGEDEEQDGEGAGGSEDESESDKHKGSDDPDQDEEEGDENEGGEAGDSDSEDEGEGASDEGDEDEGGDADEEGEGSGDGDKPDEEEHEGGAGDEEGDEEGDAEDEGEGSGSRSEGEDESEDDGEGTGDEGEQGEGDTDERGDGSMTGDGDGDEEGESEEEGGGEDSEEPQDQQESGEGAEENGVGAPIDIDLDQIQDTDGALEEALKGMLAGAFSDRTQVHLTRDYDKVAPYEAPRHVDVSGMENEVKTVAGALQKELQRLVVARSQSYFTPGFKSGRLNGPSLHRLQANDDRVFKRRHIAETNKVAVSLVVDLSGSMRGTKVRTALIAAWAFSEVLDRLRIPNEVCGFTDGDLHSVPDQKEYREQFDDFVRTTGLDASAVRMWPIWMPIFKSYDEKFTQETKRRLAHMADTQRGMQANNDAAAVEFAGERILRRQETRKIMIVFSDGQPAAMGIDGAVQFRSLTTNIAKLEKQGVEILGIGIQDASVKRFYKKAHMINTVAELPRFVMGELKALLTQPVGR